jgi:hypothetical protein
VAPCSHSYDRSLLQHTTHGPQLALPLLYEPQMARAQALFGTRLQLASAGFTVMVVIATARIWGARIQSNSLLMRTTSFTMMVVAACVTVLCAMR